MPQPNNAVTSKYAPAQPQAGAAVSTPPNLQGVQTQAGQTSTSVSALQNTFIQPQLSPNIFGIDTTIFFSFIVPVAVAILGAILSAYFSKKMRDKLKVKVVSTLNDKKFQRLSTLYCDRIPDYERVPPNHFRAFLHPRYSANSIRDFKNRIQRSKIPVHLLLVAQTSNRIFGFVKAIFIPNIRCVYIAYLVAAPGGGFENQEVAQRLLSSFFKACQNAGVKSIIYEICKDSDSKHKAKSRLYRHYASVFGIKLRCINAKYQQPEICSFDAGDCKITEAELHIAYIEDYTQDALRNIDFSEYKDIVISIYKHVYLSSYVMAEPQLVEKYKKFLLRVANNLFFDMEKKQ